MDTQVTPKPSIEAEFLAAFKAVPAAETVAKPAEVAAVEAEPPIEVADPAAVVEQAKVEAKVETPTLARRLATLAGAEKRAKDAEAARAADKVARDARDAEIGPIVDRIKKAQSAPSKIEAARLALGYDDDQMAELFIELHRHNEAAGDPPKPKDPMADLDARLEAKVEERLKARDDARKAADDAGLASMRATHVANVLGALTEKGDDYPLVAIAPPSEVDITAISEAWLVANGEIPEPEAVLKLIQDQRQTGFDERRAAAEAKKAGKKDTAPKAKADGEASGGKAKIPRNDVALTAPRKLTVAEEFLQAYRAAGA